MSTIHYSDYATSDYPQTFGELLDWSLARIPNPETKVYFRITGQTPITYAEFARNVGRICNLFMSLGLRKGDHVAMGEHRKCHEYDDCQAQRASTRRKSRSQ